VCPSDLRRRRATDTVTTIGAWLCGTSVPERDARSSREARVRTVLGVPSRVAETLCALATRTCAGVRSQSSVRYRASGASMIEGNEGVRAARHSKELAPLRALPLVIAQCLVRRHLRCVLSLGRSLRPTQYSPVERLQCSRPDGD
jgi:hypothetical protein